MMAWDCQYSLLPAKFLFPPVCQLQKKTCYKDFKYRGHQKGIWHTGFLCVVLHVCPIVTSYCTSLVAYLDHKHIHTMQEASPQEGHCAQLQGQVR